MLRSLGNCLTYLAKDSKDALFIIEVYHSIVGDLLSLLFMKWSDIKSIITGKLFSHRWRLTIYVLVQNPNSPVSSTISKYKICHGYLQVVIHQFKGHNKAMRFGDYKIN